MALDTIVNFLPQCFLNCLLTFSSTDSAEFVAVSFMLFVITEHDGTLESTCPFQIYSVIVSKKTIQW
jgi:hypothetical protein